MLTVNELLGNGKTISEYITTSFEDQNKKIEELRNMSFNERQFTIFKMCYNGLSKGDKALLEATIKKYPFILNRIYPLIDEANIALEHKMSSLYNREKRCTDIMEEYNLLINKILLLAKELDISNSLELCILYSYLLWNGYLSKTKENVFKSYGRKFINGLYFADIMDGIGVCLNHADMLRDILKISRYTSIMLENSQDDNINVNYKLDIERNGVVDIPRPLSERLFRKKKANHVFNLIEENNKLYIYDSTNMLLYNLVDSNYSRLVNGKGKNKLFPYQSYDFTYSKEEEELLDKVIMGVNNTSPYTNEDFVSTSEVNLEIIRNSVSLLEDFYHEARIDIIGIAEKTDKIVRTKKNN